MMNGVKNSGSGWQTVKSRTDEKKKRQDEKRKQNAEQKKDRLGVPVKSDVFAVFDRVYQDEKPKATAKPLAHGDYKGAYAHLVDEAPAAPSAGSDSGSSDNEAGPASSSNNTSSTQAAAKAKKPKVKKPKIQFAAIAESVDIPLLQVKLVELQQRYASAPTSQLEVLSDLLLATFKEVSLDLGKTLATRGLEQASDIPVRDVPSGLYNALSSFLAAAPQASLSALVVTLVRAILEGLPDTTPKPGQPQPPPPAATATTSTRSKAGLLLMLALVLRTQPQALVLAVPGLRVLGVRGLTGGPRLLHLLWVLQQAAAAEPAAAVATWLRLLLPWVVGAAELPGTSSKGSKAVGDATTAAAAAAGGVMDAAAAAAALQYLRDLLRQAGPGLAPVLSFEAGGAEASVPGAAVELITRAAAGIPLGPTLPPQRQQQAGGKQKGGKAAGPSAEVLQEVGVLVEPLRILAGAGVRVVGAGEWLPLALETASLSTAPVEAPDALVKGAARSMAACLAAAGDAPGLWESKHKAGLKGSARILVAFQQQPALLAPTTKAKPQQQQLRALFAALPARHRSHLLHGKGWQQSCAKAAEGACAALSRRGGGGGGSGGGGSAVLSALGMLGGVAALAGVGVMAAVHRREVRGLLAHYAGKDAAAQVDELLLGPLSQAVDAAAAAAAPHLQQLQQQLGPHWEAAQEVAGPHLEAAATLLQGYLAQAQHVLGPLAQQALEVQQAALQQLEDIWQRAKQG